ncbi:MAG: hypothetical protein E7645_00925 [Ruminococcaceae bacterium]|nr:hypothetical protein [Oscillospiraceae bacterium]
MSEKIRVFCKLYLGYAAIAAFCLMYVLTAFIDLEPTGRTVPMILADGLMAFAFGVGIASLFKTQGLATGAREPEVINAVKEHEALVEEIVEADGMESLADWCAEQNMKNYRTQRAKILSKAGMTYAECFTYGGTALPCEVMVVPVKDIKRLGLILWIRRCREARRKRIAYYRAVGLKLTELSIGELMGEGSRSDDPYWMGRGVAEYHRQTTVSDVLGKIISSVVLGYYGVKMVTDFSLAGLLWIVIQVIFFVVLGTLKYSGAFSYMTTEYRERRIKKTRHLKKYQSEHEKALEEGEDAGKEKKHEFE